MTTISTQLFIYLLQRSPSASFLLGKLRCSCIVPYPASRLTFNLSRHTNGQQTPQEELESPQWSLTAFHKLLPLQMPKYPKYLWILHDCFIQACPLMAAVPTVKLSVCVNYGQVGALNKISNLGRCLWLPPLLLSVLIPAAVPDFSSY